jgi:ribose 5-phosphate isomerase B
MNKLVIAIASDHAGFDLKSALKKVLENYASKVLDLGTSNGDSVDYSDYGNLLAESILSGKADKGVAICGSGIGISIAANRHKGIRAALCSDARAATLARQHNDANVLCLGARMIDFNVAADCIKHFFTTDFEGGRHTKRVEKLG